MANKQWVSTNGDMATAASWLPSGALSNADLVLFDGSSQQDAVSGLDLTAYTNFEGCWIQEAYEGNIGADGNALHGPFRYILHQGSGSLFSKFMLHSVNTDQYIIIDSPNQIDAYTMTASDGASGASLTLVIKSGGVKIVDNTSLLIGRMIVGGGTWGSGPRVSIGNISGNSSYKQTSGYVTTKNVLGGVLSTDHVVIDGGTLVFEADADTTANWSNVEVTGGRFIYNGDADMTTCVVSSGTLDMTQDPRAKTITTLTLLPGAEFLTHDKITVTTLRDLRPKFPLMGVTLP